MIHFYIMLYIYSYTVIICSYTLPMRLSASTMRTFLVLLDETLLILFSTTTRSFYVNHADVTAPPNTPS